MVEGWNPRRHRLLVVEDDEEIRDQLAELLVSEGFDVESAGDGDEGLALLRSRPSFDLIVLDLMLPKKDGWEFRVMQRADPVLSTIPVIVMSANTSSRARAIDADAYVPKPFEPDAMVSTIRRVIDERRHVHLDRLTSLGRMAAGIAHEVNNPLTYVYASLVLAQNILAARAASDPEGVAPLSSVGAAVEKAIHGVERMRSIMGGVRLFIRAPDDHLVPLDVRTVVESALAIAGHESERRATVEKQLGQVPLMRGNGGQLGQLIINLISNATDSIAPGDPGAHRIIVRTSTSEYGEVVIEVIDNGSGMSEDVQEKIFEPFFTTKPPGLGTGLGLSICHGIVRGHDGTISVKSMPGGGTAFRVVFPPAHAFRASLEQSKAGYRERRLLIVEDNEHVGDALAQILATDYDATLVMADGDKATALLEDDGAKFETILCDVHLGRTTGKQLYERLRRTRPELAKRIVFMTGAACSGPIRQFLEETLNPCLTKPFNRSEFRKAVDALPLGIRKASGTQMKAVALEPSDAEEGTRPGRSKRS